MKKPTRYVKCDYCGCLYGSDLENCSRCGAPNEHILPDPDNKTIRKPGSAAASRVSTSSGGANSLTKKGLLALGALVIILILIGIFIRSRNLEFREGYYKTNDSLYYYSEKYYGLDTFHWYKCVSDQWIGPYSLKLIPEELTDYSSAKKYRITDEKRKSLGYSDFRESICYRDIQAGSATTPGYYKVNTNVYYHNSRNVMMDWYLNDQHTWQELKYTQMPEELKHSSLLGQYEYVPDAAELDKLPPTDHLS